MTVVESAQPLPLTVTAGCSLRRRKCAVGVTADRPGCHTARQCPSSTLSDVLSTGMPLIHLSSGFVLAVLYVCEIGDFGNARLPCVSNAGLVDVPRDDWP